jgi:hypothetical protein
MWIIQCSTEYRVVGGHGSWTKKASDINAALFPANTSNFFFILIQLINYTTAKMLLNAIEMYLLPQLTKIIGFKPYFIFVNLS